MATIAENLNRLQTAKANIKNAIVAKGVAVADDAKIDTYSTYVSQISGGGGDDSALRGLIDKTITAITIPAGTTKIGAATFQNCYDLQTVSIPNSVTDIEGSAFQNCSGLTSINIPNSVTSLGSWVFVNCSGLTSVVIPDSVTTIVDHTFLGCENLTSVTLSNNQTVIGTEEFNGCRNIQSLVIPDSVTTVGSYAFNDCNSLSSLTIGSGVTIVGDGAFNGCDNLYNWVDGIKYVADCIGYECDNSQSTYNLKDGTKFIISGLFNNCDPLTSVTAPDTVVFIGYRAFENRENLVSFTGANHIKYIQDNVFNNCTNLSAITIGNDIERIDDDAFINCTSLPVVDGIRYADTVAIGYTDSEQSAYTIQDGTVFINKRAFADNENIKSVVIPEGVKYISDCSLFNIGITSLTTPSTIKKIGREGIRFCESLQTVRINAGYIDEYNLSHCNSLQTVYFGTGVTHISGAIFEESSLDNVTINYDGTVEQWKQIEGYENVQKRVYCSDGAYPEIGTLVIPDGTENIEGDAYRGDDSFSKLIIPSSVTSVGNDAFHSCSELKEVVINGSGLTDSLGLGTFAECPKLTTINLPESLTVIGGWLLYECPSLTSITIPESVTSIGDSSFSGCTALTSITIPSNVTLIENNAFYNCTALTSIAYNGTTEQWNNISKVDAWHNGVPASDVTCTDGTVPLT